MRILTIALLSVLVALPAAAQDVDNFTGDRLRPDDSNPALQEDFGAILNRPLPFKDGQMLRYFNDKGQFEGYAKRSRLTIRFFEPDGTLIGRAERVSQSATNYYTADGAFLGRRLHQKQTTRTQTQNSSARGFYFPHLEKREE